MGPALGPHINAAESAGRDGDGHGRRATHELAHRGRSLAVRVAHERAHGYAETPAEDPCDHRGQNGEAAVDAEQSNRDQAADAEPRDEADQQDGSARATLVDVEMEPVEDIAELLAKEGGRCGDEQPDQPTDGEDDVLEGDADHWSAVPHSSGSGSKDTSPAGDRTMTRTSGWDRRGASARIRAATSTPPGRRA